MAFASKFWLFLVARKINLFFFLRKSGLSQSSYAISQPLRLAQKRTCILSRANETWGNILLRLLEKEFFLFVRENNWREALSSPGVCHVWIEAVVFLLARGPSQATDRDKVGWIRRKWPKTTLGFMRWLLPPLNGEDPTGRGWVLLTCAGHEKGLSSGSTERANSNWTWGFLNAFSWIASLTSGT